MATQSTTDPQNAMNPTFLDYFSVFKYVNLYKSVMSIGTLVLLSGLFHVVISIAAMSMPRRGTPTWRIHHDYIL